MTTFQAEGERAVKSAYPGAVIVRPGTMYGWEDRLMSYLGDTVSNQLDGVLVTLVSVHLLLDVLATTSLPPTHVPTYSLAYDARKYRSPTPSNAGTSCRSCHC